MVSVSGPGRLDVLRLALEGSARRKDGGGASARAGGAGGPAEVLLRLFLSHHPQVPLVH